MEKGQKGGYDKKGYDQKVSKGGGVKGEKFWWKA